MSFYRYDIIYHMSERRVHVHVICPRSLCLYSFPSFWSRTSLSFRRRSCRDAWHRQSNAATGRCFISNAWCALYSAFKIQYPLAWSASGPEFQLQLSQWPVCCPLSRRWYVWSHSLPWFQNPRLLLLTQRHVSKCFLEFMTVTFFVQRSCIGYRY